MENDKVLDEFKKLEGLINKGQEHVIYMVGLVEKLQAENVAQRDEIERLKKEINKLHETIAYKNADIVRLQMNGGG